jgi:hypothetical protein
MISGIEVVSECAFVRPPHGGMVERHQKASSGSAIMPAAPAFSLAR